MIPPRKNKRGNTLLGSTKTSIGDSFFRGLPQVSKDANAGLAAEVAL